MIITADFLFWAHPAHAPQRTRRTGLSGAPCPPVVGLAWLNLSNPLRGAGQMAVTIWPSLCDTIFRQETKPHFYC
jgi:hypothetical protein